LLIKPKKDLQLRKKQITSQPALQEEQLDHQRELEQVSGGWNTARQGSEEQPTMWATLTEGPTIASNISTKLRQVLKNTTARSIKGNFGKIYALLKENRTAKHSEPSSTH
jgi:hypothetical protein